LVLRKEEEISFQKIQAHELDPTRPVEVHRLKKYIELDDAIYDLVVDFDNLVLQGQANIREVKNHLRALTYRLHKPEDWD